jgi:hypothetical protein
MVLAPKQERPIVVEGPRQLAPQHRALLPAIGGALIWFGSEIVPRLVPLALDALERHWTVRLGLSNWNQVGPAGDAVADKDVATADAEVK